MLHAPTEKMAILVKELTKLKRSKGNLVKVRNRTAIGANTHVWIRK